MKTLKTLLFFLALLASGALMARTSVPVIQLLDQPTVATSGQSLSLEQVQSAIRNAAQARKWVVTVQPDGKLVAVLSWNDNKHAIVVDIACQTDRYSITYKDSINMKYAAGNGQPTIHPHYNRFVSELGDAIRVELMKL